MGAYENPEIAIDTQSGQHIRSMIGNVAGSAISVIKEFKAKEEAFAKKRNELGTEIVTSTNETAGKIKTGSIFDIKPMVDSVKNVLLPLSSAAVSNDFTKSAAALNEIQVKQGQFKKTAESVVTEPVQYWETQKKAAMKTPGTIGGMYTETPEDYRDRALSLIQNKGAKASVDFMKNEKGEYDLTDANISYSITKLNGETKNVPYSLSAIINKNQVFPDGEYTIPDMRDDDTIKSLSNIFNVKDDKIEEGLSDIILNDPKFVKEGRKPMGQSAKGDKSGKVVSAGDYVTTIVDRDAIAAQPSAIKASGAVIESMLQTNPRGLAMYANDILRRQFPDLLSKIKNIDDVSEISTFIPQITEAYSRSLVYKQLPNPEIIKKDIAGNPVYIKTATEKADGDGKDKKPTQGEITKAEEKQYIQDRYNKVKDGHGRYPLSSDGKIVLDNGKLKRIIKDPSIPNAPATEVDLTPSERAKYGL